MRIGAWRLAATLLALALPSPALAQVVQPNDPNFPPMPGWQDRIGWEPPSADVGYPDVGYPVIAIVDTGLWSGFDDFAGYLDDESADCVNKPATAAARRMERPTDVEDLFGHGTKVAAIAAAPANGKGTVGVSPNSHVIIVRAALNDGAFNVTCAFDYLATIAKDQPLVVNVSVEFASPPRGGQAALDRLIAAGALVVAAAGNTNNGPVAWPASAQHVLAVGRDDRGQGATGAKLDLVAPGKNLSLPLLGGGFGVDSGTSFSSPIVAGAAARVWGPLDVGINPQAVTYLLRKYASPNAGTQGFGRVNIKQTQVNGARKLPRIDDFEPNDKVTESKVKTVRCPSSCTLRGLVSSTDDPTDYWKLSRGTCPKQSKIKTTGGANAHCIRVRGRGTYIKVRASTRKPSLNLYVVTIRP